MNSKISLSSVRKILVDISFSNSGVLLAVNVLTEYAAAQALLVINPVVINPVVYYTYLFSSKSFSVCCASSRWDAHNQSRHT